MEHQQERSRPVAATVSIKVVDKVVLIPGVAKSFLSCGSLDLTNRVTSAVEADYFHTTIIQCDMIRKQQQDPFCSFYLHTSRLPKMLLSRKMNAIFTVFMLQSSKEPKLRREAILEI